MKVKRGVAGALVLLAVACSPQRPVTAPAAREARSPEKKNGVVFLDGGWLSRLGGERGFWLGRFEGEPYPLGYVFGRLTRERIRAQETHLERLFTALVPSGFARWWILQASAFRLRHTDRQIPPDLLLSIAGVADGYEPLPPASGWPAYRRTLSLHALHDVSQHFVDAPALSSACTGFLATGTATKDGHLLLARNFDFEGGEIFDDEKIVSIVVPAGRIPYLSVGFSGMLGVVSGFNREGIGVALQAIAGGETAGSGTPMTLLMADVLENDATFEAAVDRIRKAHVFVSDLVLIGDGKTGRMAILEKTPSGFFVREPGNAQWLATANEAGADLLGAKEGRKRPQPTTSTSAPRLARLRQLLADSSLFPLDASRAVTFLRDRRSVSGAELGPGNRNAIDALIAAHSIVFDLTARRAWVAAAPHTLGPYLAVDLGAVLSRPDGPPSAIESIPADPWLSDGTWERYRAAREALLAARRATHERSGTLETARAKAEEAHRLSPAFVDATAILGECEARAGHHERALALLDEALAHDPAPAPLRHAVRSLHDALTNGTALPKVSLPVVLAPDELIEENRRER
jgi:isopenicillin-N N-acyltransferase-like protein